LKFGKGINPLVFERPESTMKSIKTVFENFPSKKPHNAKEKKAAEEKKKKDEEEAAEAKLIPKTITVEECLN
jgi:hypothetical protein